MISGVKSCSSSWIKNDQAPQWLKARWINLETLSLATNEYLITNLSNTSNNLDSFHFLFYVARSYKCIRPNKYDNIARSNDL